MPVSSSELLKAINVTYTRNRLHWPRLKADYKSLKLAYVANELIKTTSYSATGIVNCFEYINIWIRIS